MQFLFGRCRNIFRAKMALTGNHIRGEAQKGANIFSLATLARLGCSSRPNVLRVDVFYIVSQSCLRPIHVAIVTKIFEFVATF